MANKKDSKNKKSKKVKFVTPPNMLKTKVGSGGLSDKILDQAQKLLENNSIDFRPIAEMYLNSLQKGIERASYSTGFGSDDDVITDISYPILQLRANGKMFKYTLITKMAEQFLEFLNSINRIDAKAIEIMQAFHTSMNVVVQGEITGDGGLEGQELQETLRDACDKYIRKLEEYTD